MQHVSPIRTRTSSISSETVDSFQEEERFPPNFNPGRRNSAINLGLPQEERRFSSAKLNFATLNSPTNANSPTNLTLDIEKLQENDANSDPGLSKFSQFKRPNNLTVNTTLSGSPTNSDSNNNSNSNINRRGSLQSNPNDRRASRTPIAQQKSRSMFNDNTNQRPDSPQNATPSTPQTIFIPRMFEENKVTRRRSSVTMSQGLLASYRNRSKAPDKHSSLVSMSGKSNPIAKAKASAMAAAKAKFEGNDSGSDSSSHGNTCNNHAAEPPPKEQRRRSLLFNFVSGKGKALSSKKGREEIGGTGPVAPSPAPSPAEMNNNNNSNNSNSNSNSNNNNGGGGDSSDNDSDGLAKTKKKKMNFNSLKNRFKRNYNSNNNNKNNNNNASTTTSSNSSADIGDNSDTDLSSIEDGGDYEQNHEFGYESDLGEDYSSHTNHDHLTDEEIAIKKAHRR